MISWDIMTSRVITSQEILRGKIKTPRKLGLQERKLGKLGLQERNSRVHAKSLI